MIEQIFNGILGFFNSLIDTGSTAAQGFVSTGSTAANGVYNTVTGSLGNVIGSL
ncbi:hypothetical protein [Dietzia cinnamea]|uniref:hypothetical protein n=1 Tax=Dietzia cinnamea TaxID=321318 RepID=UPI00223AAC22|nr:hypothetical protein [Dietzia cinnamea]MCT2061133.1 hypothetical protein [Dietzia cinnamea]MCT2236910.1 hypothetical protein [Dietzia cinnamea]MCT2302274.1 hypothetical protein [Dietzia cinnamea]